MGIDADAELDEHDVLGSPTTVHVLAVRTAAAAGGNGNGHGRHRSGRDETVVGACRVRAAAGTIIKVERVVVAAAARRGGIAGAMVAYAAGQVGVDARLPAGSAVALHAMAHRAGLYSRLGELTYGRRLDVVTSPVQVLMGDLVAQVAVVRHGGVEIELLRRQAVLPPGKAPAPDW
ncbi:hypothetical protein MMPV_004440 [Pyropia vietnamensis]